MKEDIFPNLFIVGAPKCGTTTLHYWLSLHPNVYMTAHKEPSYWCGFNKIDWSGPGSNTFRKGLVENFGAYKSLFSTSKKYKLVGEASTDYLWVEQTPEKISKFCGNIDTKIIIIIRNHVERAFSEHMHLIREGREDLDFISSFQLEDFRYSQSWQPLFYHYRRGIYEPGIKRFHNVFGRENVIILSFDEIKSNPERTFINICNFLRIAPYSIPKKIVLNRSGVPRSLMLHKILKKNTIIKRLIKKLTGEKFGRSMISLFDNYNLKKAKITKNEREFAWNLFYDDFKNLQNLIDINISHWN
jgi:Sulfotransferase domain